jgi:hypothetical protein
MVSLGQPTLTAHGKLWVWWSPHADAPVFKVPVEEREMLVAAESGTFFVTHSPVVLMRPDKLDLAWAKANLIRVWRAQAPKARAESPRQQRRGCGSMCRDGKTTPVAQGRLKVFRALSTFARITQSSTWSLIRPIACMQA